MKKSYSFLDYHECEKYISDKLGYPLRDTLRSDSHYRKWCDLVGEVCDDNSVDQYSRYVVHPEGFAKRPEYRDWWHFLVNCRSFGNPGLFHISSDLLEFGNEWQNEITQAFLDEFGDNGLYYIDW